MATEQTMNDFSIADVITENLIQLEMKAKTKKEAIHELTRLLMINGDIEDEEVFIEDVFQREAEGITGIGNSIAIPHGKSDSVIKTSLVVGKTTTPIEWESLDDEPVRVIILFAVKNTDANTMHIKLLQKVAMLLADEDFIENMLNTQTKSKMLELLSQDPLEE
ncbi:PTS sugar transporter subunit IIA [Enterococcus xiangfangensis]|uniref:Fructose PTS transporter subunit IIA n=1 Tax=Enterococcus xiangfangensis TaxID=1296537 RepID=A0ABU3F821_9ENTE|nr:fructose PTS transporter subunit IIA [Enterococcus xiangfangensis]MDT2758807.1 fructose PTS transporter subunit IIA [Enterococcus xiangfangensis]